MGSFAAYLYTKKGCRILGRIVSEEAGFDLADHRFRFLLVFSDKVFPGKDDDFLNTF